MWLSEKLQSMGETFRRTPPAFRRGVAMLVDALIVVESFAVALIVRVSGDTASPPFWPYFWPFAVFSALAFVLLLNWNGVYHSTPHQLRFGISQGVLYQDVRLLGATAMAAGGLFLAVFAVGPAGFGIMRFNPVPLAVVLVGSALAYAQFVAVRLLGRARGSRAAN
jgi:hypothetical protein